MATTKRKKKATPSLRRIADKLANAGKTIVQAARDVATHASKTEGAKKKKRKKTVASSAMSGARRRKKKTASRRKK